jgi:phospholipase C
MRARSTVLAVALAAILALVVSCATQTTSARGGLSGVEHILVIYAENRSFDNLYAFPRG